MTNKSILVACALLGLALTSPIEPKAKTLVRINRGIMDWKIFGGSTTKAPETTTAAPIRPNHIEIGTCEDDDKVNGVTFV